MNICFSTFCCTCLFTNWAQRVILCVLIRYHRFQRVEYFFFFYPRTESGLSMCLFSCLIDSLAGISPALLSGFQISCTKFCCRFTRYLIPALTSHLLHLRIFLEISFSCNRISLLALINTLPLQQNNLCLCFCLTLGSLTCLGLPAWLTVTQSLLFCSAPIFAPHYLITLTGMPGE